MKQKESVYDSIEQAMTQIESGEKSQGLDTEIEDAPEELVDDQDVIDDAKERVRDESGRFKSKTQEEPEHTQEAQEDSPQEVEQVKADPEAEELKNIRPQSFKDKDLWDKMVSGAADKSDQKAIAKYYVEREGQFHKGLEGYKDMAAKNNYLSQAMEPYIPRLMQEHTDPAQFIRNIADSHFAIVNASPENKAHIFNRLASQYGITMSVNGEGGYQAQPMDYQSQAMQQQMQHYEREITALKQWREHETSAMLQGEISQLVDDRNNFPYFDELREPMAQLLESGHAKTFEDAYKRAVRLNDAVWEKEQTRLLSQRRNTTNTSAVTKAKNLAVSPKTSAPRQSSSQNSNKSVRELLEEQFYG